MKFTSFEWKLIDNNEVKGFLIFHQHVAVAEVEKDGDETEEGDQEKAMFH